MKKRVIGLLLVMVCIMTACGHSDMNKNESKNKEIHQTISNQKELSPSDSKVIIEKDKNQDVF